MISQLNAQPIDFPADAGLINVRDHGVLGDGLTDDTAALQKVFDDFNGSGAVIYLPAGTYLLKDTIRWQGRFTNTILQGQGQDHTIIRLADGSDGYGDAKKPKPLFYTGGPPAQRFRNAVRDLTIDTGSNNAGAVGLNFCANNQGIVRNVTIRSGAEGKQPGAVGLALDQGEVGPLMVKNLRVIGFDLGIRVRHSVNSVTLEDIELSNQRVAGIDNHNNLVFVRKLTSRNSVPAVVNDGPDGVFLVIDAKLDSPTSTNVAAMQNRHARAQMFARNVETSGYANAIDSAKQTVPSGKVTEWVSEAPLMLFAGTGRSLDLPVVETPQVAWGDVSKWVNVQDFGARPDDDKDDTEAIQKAIDSGAETIYFPRGVMLPPRERGNNPGWRGAYFVSKTIHIRGNVRRLIGFEATFYYPVPKDGDVTMPLFSFDDGTAPVVAVERMMFQIGNFFPNPAFVHNSKRDLVLSSFTGARSLIHQGTGRLFVEDVVGTQPWRLKPGSTMYARQLNIEGENTEEPKLINEGGTAWVLGFKTEHRAPVLATYDGGTTEILGAHFYTCVKGSQDKVMMEVRDARMTVAGAGEYVWTPDWATNTLLSETRGGENRTLSKTPLIRRGGGSMLPLVVCVPADEKAVMPPQPQAKLAEQTAGSITISLADDPAAAGYRILRDGELVGIRKHSFVDTAVAPGKRYAYDVIAFNVTGDLSKPTRLDATTPADTVAPTKPGDIEIVELTDRRVHLRWKPSTDQLGVRGYTLTRRRDDATGEPVSEAVGKTEYVDEKVEAGVTYVYSVAASDAGGNVSEPALVKVKVLSEPPPETVVELERPSSKHKLLKTKGWQIGNLSEGLWATYDEVRFDTAKPFNRAALRYGLPDNRAGVEIDLFLDATIEGYEERPGKNRADVTDGEVKGKLLGTFKLKSTGGFDKKDEVVIPIDAPANGTHSLTIRVRQGDSKEKNALGDLDKMRLFSE